ncbi:MAG: transposase [Akkermansia sp.]
MYANTNAPIGVLQKAINYTVKLKGRLQVYLDHPEAGIDNNPVERAVRKVAIGRKNWTFIGHPDAGRKTAIYYTMITECKRVGIDPMKWLTHVFEQIPQLKGERNQYLTLLPETYAEAQQTQN